MISVWFCENMTFFPNFYSYHIFAIYVGGASLGLPTACRLIAVSGARLPSVDGLVVRCIKMHLPSQYVCNLFKTCLRYIRVCQHTEALLLCFTNKKLRHEALGWRALKTPTSATPVSAVTWPRSRFNTFGPDPLGFDWEDLAASRGTAGGHSGRSPIN